MELVDGIEAVDLGLWIREEKVLVLCDLHIGYEDALQKQGVLVPRRQYKDIIARLDLILHRVQPETIVINGDLKHEFGSITAQEWKEVLQFLDYLEDKCKRIVLVKGNHDTILGPLAAKKGLEVVEEYRVGDVLMIHGNAVPEKIAKVIVMGHEHPAIGLRMEGRTEKFKCFLVGKWRRSTLIVQPSFNLLVEGTDLSKEGILSPLLKKGVDDFEVWVVDDRSHTVRPFGNLRDLEVL